MSAARKRSNRNRTGPRAWLMPILGVALVGLAAALFMLLGSSGGEDGVRSETGDFADVVRRTAARRGDFEGRRREDDPIRKENGVFVRTWRLTFPDREALEGMQADLMAEASRRGATVTIEKGAEPRIRIDLGTEAFEILPSVVPATPTVTPTPVRPSPTPTPTPRPPLPPDARGVLAILLDDGGQTMNLVSRVAALPRAVGVAVLPFLPKSSETAVVLDRAGHEIWLHLPMEPTGYPATKPGPGAVLVSMSEDEVRMTVRSALNNVPHVVGVNNHMGSRATANLRTMTWVMQEIGARGLAFIDSRTTVETVAETAARAQGVPTGRRHVFLDNERTAVAVRRQLDEAVYRARATGSAIAIGHMAPVTVSVLEEELPGIERRSVTLIPPSKATR